jgi:hypothetical protein
MHVVGPRGGTCGHHIYQIYASYLHVRILYEFLGTFQSLKVFGKFKNKSKCFWKPSSKFTIRNGYLVTVYKSGFEACLWSTSCASALVLALEIRRISSPCVGRRNLILRSVVSNRSPRVTHFTLPGPHTNICMAGSHTNRRKSPKIAENPSFRPTSEGHSYYHRP